MLINEYLKCRQINRQKAKKKYFAEVGDVVIREAMLFWITRRQMRSYFGGGQSFFSLLECTL